jgi:hypothetical protein
MLSLGSGQNSLPTQMARSGVIFGHEILIRIEYDNQFTTGKLTVIRVVNVMVVTMLQGLAAIMTR